MKTKSPNKQGKQPGTLSLARPLRSVEHSGARVAVMCEFVNESEERLVVSWVTSAGERRHERHVAPGQSHCESTFDGDAFVVCAADAAEVCWYRPHAAGSHRVRVQPSADQYFLEVDVEHHADTKRKSEIRYRAEVAAGFAVEVDLRVDEEWQVARLRRDLRSAREKFPKDIASKLADTTKIIVNRETSGLRGCCYHGRDGAPWLAANGLPVRFAGCVHVYCLADFCQQADLWGAGGCVVHELAHAYHDKFLHRGHDNPAIRARFLAALPLYRNVRVKPHFRYARHYACTNPAEFFAELSTAFLETGSGLYNKWEPHNRHQLAALDPETTLLLRRVWLDQETLTDDPKAAAASSSSSGEDWSRPHYEDDDDDDDESLLLSSNRREEERRRPRFFPYKQHRSFSPPPLGGLEDGTTGLLQPATERSSSGCCLWLPCLFLRHVLLRGLVTPASSASSSSSSKRPR